MSVAAPTPEVPNDWDIAKVEDVCEVQNGFAFKSVHFNDKGNGLPLIRIRDVHNGSSKTYYSGEYGEKFVVSDGDLLVGMDGEFRVRRWGAGKGLLNQRVCRLLPLEGPMTTDFLYYSIGRPLKQIEDFTPFTTVKHISAKQIRAIELPLPPLPEQKKIARILSTVQRAIEAQERIIQTTTELKKSLMHKLFTEGLRNAPQKQTEIGPVPESWEVVELESLFAKQPQNGLYKPKKDYGSGTQILRIDDFGNDGDVVTSAGNLVALERSEIETYGLEPGDLVINRVNSLSHLGKTALIGDLDGEMVFESNMMRFSVDPSQVQKEYVFKYLNSPLAKKQIIGTAKRAVAQSSINQGDVKAILVPKATPEEQLEIVAALDSTEAKIAQASDKANVLQDLFRTLLHELMTAKTRVHRVVIQKI